MTWTSLFNWHTFPLIPLTSGSVIRSCLHFSILSPTWLQIRVPFQISLRLWPCRSSILEREASDMTEEGRLGMQHGSRYPPDSTCHQKNGQEEKRRQATNWVLTFIPFESSLQDFCANERPPLQRTLQPVTSFQWSVLSQLHFSEIKFTRTTIGSH